MNKSLLITGARQVGKTYIIRQFLKENFIIILNLIYMKMKWLK